jgi:hypothetical protein
MWDCDKFEIKTYVNMFYAYDFEFNLITFHVCYYGYF